MLPESVDWTKAFYWLTFTSVQLLDFTFIVYVPPEVHLSYLYVHIGYATRSNSKGATILLYYRVKIAKRGRIDISPKLGFRGAAVHRDLCFNTALLENKSKILLPINWGNPSSHAWGGWSPCARRWGCWLHSWRVCAGLQVEGHILKVGYFDVDLGGYTRTTVFVHTCTMIILNILYIFSV